MKIIQLSILTFLICSLTTMAQTGSTNQGQKSGTLGDRNSFFGTNAGRDNIATASNNSFFGFNTGRFNTGVNNSFLGANSGQSNTTGGANTFVGRNSGNQNTTGNHNVFLGNAAGFESTVGNFNTVVGAFAGRENSAGLRNVFIGASSGRNNTGNGNVFVGYNAGREETRNNRLYIDNSDTNQPLIYGNFNTDQVGINTNTIPDGYSFAVGGSANISGDIVSTGRIAIGTTAEDPDYKLTVKGKIHVQEVRVDLLGAIAPDYVFYEDYDLKTLEEVQSYINKEGHLPNIPSAAEMQKEGINLKEMNLKLLEKVEELTLYTIAQETAIKEQEFKYKKQEEKNKVLEERLLKLEKLLQQ